MESDEKYIASHFGREQHFGVPEGYFDTLAESIMKNVETADAVAPAPTVRMASTMRVGWWTRYRKVVAAAACVLFIGGGAATYFAVADNHNGEDALSASAGKSAVQQASGAYAYDEMADYSMLDSDDIYSLIASN